MKILSIMSVSYKGISVSMMAREKKPYPSFLEGPQSHTVHRASHYVVAAAVPSYVKNST